MDKFWSPIGHSPLVRWSSSSKNDKGVKIPYDNVIGSPENAVTKEGYCLVFQDEFDNEKFDTLQRVESFKVMPFDGIYTNTEYGTVGKYPKWIVQKQQTGWENGHNCTTKEENSYVEFGKLKQKVTKDAQNKYYSTVINSNAQIRYGYFEAKIKNPKGKMIWPAFWLYKAGGGNGCGNGYNYHEIDIYEIFQRGRSDNDGFHDGRKGNGWRYSCGRIKDLRCPQESQVGANIWAYAKRGEVFKNWVKGMDLSKDFFIFAAEWSPEKICYYLNNVCVFEIPNNTEYGLNQLPMQLILNNVTLGKVKANKKTPFPSILEVEYVRVYKKESDWQTLFQTFPKSVCANDTWNNFIISDFYPDATYSLSANNPNIQTRFGTNEWGSIGSFFIPKNLKEGNYEIQLSIHFANDSIRNIRKRFLVSADIPETPLEIDSTSNNCNCIFRPKPYNSFYTQPLTYLENGAKREIEIFNENACGKSAALRKIVNCQLQCETTVSPKREIEIMDSSHNESVFIYPNIIENQIINIHNNTNSLGEIEIFNLNGNKIYHAEIALNKSEIRLPILSTGIYYCQIICGKQIKQEKIVILNP